MDPIGTDSGVGSLFQYVDNQVATYTDPSGLICSGFSISQKCANSDYILQGTELENSAHIPIGVPFGLVKSITKPFESNGQYVGKALGQVLVIATFCCESDEEAKKMQMYQWYSGWVKVAGKYTSNDPKDVPDSGFGTSGSKSAFPFNLRTLVRTSPKRYTMVVDDRPGLGNQSNPFQYIIAPPQKWPREYSMYFRTCIGTNLSNIQACTYWGVHAYLGIKPSRGEWQCRTRR